MAYKAFQCWEDGYADAFQNNTFQLGYSNEVLLGCPSCGKKVGRNFKWKGKRTYNIKGKFEDKNRYITCWNCGFICEVK